MTGVIEIPANERGVIRVFDLDMRPEQATFLKEPGALAQVLGSAELDLEHVEIFPVADLEDLGLPGYLIQGCGVTEEEITPDLAQLETLQGYVMLLRSRAFGDAPARLTPADQIQLVASYGERPLEWNVPPMVPPSSSKPYSAAKLPPRQGRKAARKIGATLFAVVMTLIVLLLYVLVV